MSGGNHPHGDCRDCATQRAEIKRMCEERDSAQRRIEKLTGRLDDVARLHSIITHHEAENATLRARVAELEADIASRSGTWTRCRCGGTFRAPKQVGMSVPEHTCPGCRRAEVAEDKLAALEAVERAARRAKRAWITMETAHDFAEPALAADALDAALAALEVPRG